jgi:sugar lactone lactonase YvrE
VVARAASSKAIREFAILYGGAASTSAALALTAGGLVGIAAVGCALAWNDDRRGPRLLARGAAALWIVAAASPATLIALGLETTFNHAATAAVYDGPVIVFLGLVARVGVVAAVVAPFAAALESRRSRALRRLDGPESVGGLWRVRRPVLLAAFLLAASAGTALAFGELATTARLRPPSVDILATSTLNAIHYQQPETVLLAATISAAIGLLVAAVFARTAIRPLARLGAVLAVAAVGLAGCRDAADAHAGGTPPLPVAVAFGSPGFGPGQFRTPRVLAVEPKTGCLYVIDKEARVQRFSADGVFETEWSMPMHVQGCPVGISIHPDGRVFISDTHYHRIVVYDRDGHELARFGQYGKGPGEFIYPTDIAFHPDGRIYVAEYGSNDRIQVFDASFRPIAAFGSMGAEDGQFGRPQSIVFDPVRDELYVADSNNHRIVVTDADGRWLRSFGSIGTGPGELAYPRGLILVGDGTVLVNEFGNHRVQHLDARPGASLGASLGMWGGPATGSRSGAGVSAGSLQYPWDLDGTLERFAITDSATDRVVVSGFPKANGRHGG